MSHDVEQPPMILGTITLSKRRRVQVALVSYNYRQSIDLRVQFAFEDGDWTPTRRGVRLPLDQLPPLVAFLEDAEVRARRLGLLDAL